MTEFFYVPLRLHGGWNGHRIRVSTQIQLWRRKFCRDSNSQPFDHESNALTNKLSQFPGYLVKTHTKIHVTIHQSHSKALPCMARVLGFHMVPNQGIDKCRNQLYNETKKILIKYQCLILINASIPSPSPMSHLPYNKNYTCKQTPNTSGSCNCIRTYPF